MNDFIDFLKSRGYLYQCTDYNALVEHCNSSDSIYAYIGFDCTASSLHIGSLTQIMVLRALQKFDHKPIILLGGETTKIGDPSGKDKSREMLDESAVKANMEGIKSVLLKFFDDKSVEFVDNAKWLDEIKYVDFLRDFGRYFSINQMLGYENVQRRLEREQHLSFLEFNYMLLQAYDFVELYKCYGCRLQIGGSDQWGNIINGVELGRKLGFPQLFGLTTELVTTSCGKKMGKSESGVVWVDCKPYDYWQYFRNVDDKDVMKFIRLFTDLPDDEIAKLAALKGSEINEAKKILANEVVKIAFSYEVAEEVAKSSSMSFEKNDSTFFSKVSCCGDSVAIIELLKLAGVATSSAFAKRLIKEEAVKINDRVVKEIMHVVEQQGATLKVGKKRFTIDFVTENSI